jgi:hypothetical protein
VFQVRRKGRYASDTFLRRRDGEEWALEIERAIDRGVALTPRRRKGTSTFADYGRYQRPLWSCL